MPRRARRLLRGSRSRDPAPQGNGPSRARPARRRRRPPRGARPCRRWRLAPSHHPPRVFAAAPARLRFSTGSSRGLAVLLRASPARTLDLGRSKHTPAVEVKPPGRSTLAHVGSAPSPGGWVRRNGPRWAYPRGRVRLASQVGWPLLDEVISSLDSEVLRVVRAPSGDAVRVSDAVIHDPVDPHSPQTGAIVLGVGVSARDRDAVSMVEACGRCAAPALILRSDDDLPERLTDAADSWDVALLTAPPEMTWGQLYSLLRTAIVSAGAVGHGDAAGIPVGDLFALADAIAAAVGGAVTI